MVKLRERNRNFLKLVIDKKEIYGIVPLLSGVHFVSTKGFWHAKDIKIIG